MLIDASSTVIVTTSSDIFERTFLERIQKIIFSLLYSENGTIASVFEAS